MKRLIQTLCCTLTLCVSSTTIAAELSPALANPMNKAFWLQQEGDTLAAIELLQTLKPRREYDQAYLQRMLGIFYWQTEQPEKARDALEQAVAVAALPDGLQLKTRRFLADILLVLAHYDEALAHYQPVIAHITADLAMAEQARTSQLSGLWLRVAQAHYQAEHWQPVLDALTHYEQYHGSLPLKALTLRFGAELSLAAWPAARVTVAQLKQLAPANATWWQQQTGLLLQAKQYANALTNLKQYQRAGFKLTQQEFRTLAQLYAQQKTPELAAEIYQQFIDKSKPQDGLSEARYWTQARRWDQALVAWQKISQQDSQYQWEYVQLLLQLHHYQQALVVLSEMTSFEPRHLLARAEAYYHLADIKNAKVAAQEAYRIEPNAHSKQWLAYLEQQQQREQTQLSHG